MTNLRNPPIKDFQNPTKTSNMSIFLTTFLIIECSWPGRGTVSLAGAYSCPLADVVRCDRPEIVAQRRQASRGPQCTNRLLCLSTFEYFWLVVCAFECLGLFLSVFDCFWVLLGGVCGFTTFLFFECFRVLLSVVGYRRVMWLVLALGLPVFWVFLTVVAWFWVLLDCFLWGCV